MAIYLTDGTDNLSFGDQSFMAGLTEFTVFLAWRVQPSGTADDRDLVSQYGTVAANRAFLLSIADNDELAVYVTNGVDDFPTGFFARKTTDLNLTANVLYRILVSVAFGSPPTIRILVNGSPMALAEIASNNVTAMANAATNLKIGAGDRGNTAAEGDYAEFACWSRLLTAEEEWRLGEGQPPSCITDTAGRRLYLPMANTSDLTDAWSSVTATLTGGSNGTHPALRSCGSRPTARFARRLR